MNFWHLICKKFSEFVISILCIKVILTQLNQNEHYFDFGDQLCMRYVR